MKNRPGATLLEFLAIIAIVGTLTAMMTPAIASARFSSKRSSSMSRMSQLRTGLFVYRADYEAAAYGSASTMGLPTVESIQSSNGRILGVSAELWMSPCGYHRDGPQGFWSYSYHASNDPDWIKLITTHVDRMPLISDLACSQGFRSVLDAPLVTKSVPYITLGGNAQIKKGKGIPFSLEWFLN